MSQTFQNAFLRALLTAFFVAGGVAFAAYETADTDCGLEPHPTADGTVMFVDDGCSWKPVIVATGIAFFGILGGRGGVEGTIDSQNQLQVRTDNAKRVTVVPRKRRKVVDDDEEIGA